MEVEDLQNISNDDHAMRLAPHLTPNNNELTIYNSLDATMTTDAMRTLEYIADVCNEEDVESLDTSDNPDSTSQLLDDMDKACAEVYRNLARNNLSEVMEEGGDPEKYRSLGTSNTAKDSDSVVDDDSDEDSV